MTDHTQPHDEIGVEAGDRVVMIDEPGRTARANGAERTEERGTVDRIEDVERHTGISDSNTYTRIFVVVDGEEHEISPAAVDAEVVEGEPGVSLQIVDDTAEPRRVDTDATESVVVERPVVTDAGKDIPPTSQWDHSHYLSAGDELVDTGEDTALSVTEVHDDGSVSVQVWRDQRHGEEYITEEYSEEQVRVGLRDGILETTDGLSDELATY